MSDGLTVTVEDVLAAAQVVAGRCAAGSPPLVAAWVLVNRVKAAQAYREANGRAHPEYGDGSLAGAAWTCREVWRVDPQSFWRAAAALCAVLGGTEGDPTDGSTVWT